MPSEMKNEQDIKSLIEEIEKKHGKTPEMLYAEREKRIMSAIVLEEPDRVPIMFHGGYFPIRYAGLSPSVVFYDPAIHKQAFIKAILDFEFDAVQLPVNMLDSGRVLETLDAKLMRWPGGNLRPDQLNHFVDMEVMKENEYDLFMTDPTDFMLRYFLPRTYGALEPLSRFPTLGQNLATSRFFYGSPGYTGPEFQEVAQTLLRVGQEQKQFSDWTENVGALGFPPVRYSGGVAGPAFDWVTNYLRGMRGAMTDIYRRPEKVLAICEKVLEWRLARAVPADPKRKWNPRRVGGGASHFSSDRYLSKQQFEKFCWPTWKRSLQATIDLGFVPSPYLEGKGDDRLEYFLELPRGKVLVRLTEADMARAKAILGGHCCIEGNVPLILLHAGSPQEVEECCRDLIKVCGKGGGYILNSASGLDEAKPANVKAMVDSVKKYGRY